MNKTQKIVASTAMVIGAASITVPAHASSVNWDAIIQCESSGNPYAVNNNEAIPDYGLLQWHTATWQAYGGTGSPLGASRAENIRVAENLVAANGGSLSAWPTCGSRGYTGSISPSVEPYSAPQHSSVVNPSPAQDEPSESNTGTTTTYTVKSGDTLSAIGAEYNVSWQHIYANNEKVIGDNPDLIFPGQKFTFTI